MNSTTSQSTHIVARHSRSFARAFAFVSCSALFVIALACAVQAQSGRRVQRPQETAPVPTPTPLPEAKKHDIDVTQKIAVLVLADASYTMTVQNVEGIVQQSFMQRLHESGSLTINADSARTTRGGAQKRAKDEKDHFVVWVALRSNRMGMDPVGVGQPRPQDYYIEYAVYDPVTGKTRANGNVYLRAGYGSIGGVAVGAPTCYPATYAGELEFIYGAIDAANRVMKSLSVPLPPLCGS
ncbi:MAG: hypothetical protein QOE33_1814 [Acidobacteriota bacterium]|nr:hypothetical protein [Acidobacteriota bacterium]